MLELKSIFHNRYGLSFPRSTDYPATDADLSFPLLQVYVTRSLAHDAPILKALFGCLKKGKAKLF